MSQFKKKFDFEKRRNEAKRIMDKYPERVPIIVENSVNSNLPPLGKTKYLVPIDLSIGQFMYVIRKRIKLSPDQALFIFINSTLPSSAVPMSQLYKEHKDKDGFLYATISGESTFGTS
jgi:GABA(A) receptor-associated protein